jgi:hypothetical protein
MFDEQYEFRAAIDREASRLSLSPSDCGGVLLGSASLFLLNRDMEGEIEGSPDQLLAMMGQAKSREEFTAAFWSRCQSIAPGGAAAYDELVIAGH